MRRYAIKQRFQNPILEDVTEEYEWCNGYSDEKIVDETNFRPSAESVRAKMLSPGGIGSATVGIYDFKDGIDTGFTPYRDLAADVVDLAIEKKKIIDEAKNKKAKEEALAAQKQAIKEAMEEAINEPNESNGE